MLRSIAFRYLLGFLPAWLIAATPVSAAPQPESPLEKRADTDRPLEAPLGEVIQYLRKTWDVPIEFQGKSFRDAAESVIVHCPRLRNVRIGTALEILAEQCGARLKVEKGLIIIVEAEQKSNERSKPTEKQRNVEKALKELLETKMSVDRGIGGVVLKEVVEYIVSASNTHFNWYFNETAFLKAKRTSIADKPVALNACKDQPVSKLLNKLLEQVNATYEVIDNIVVIVPAKSN